MGNPFKNPVRSIMAVGSGGLSEVTGVGKKLTEMPTISGAAADSLEDAQDSIKKKKASTFTTGGLIGEELQSGTGTIFGN